MVAKLGMTFEIQSNMGRGGKASAFTKVQAGWGILAGWMRLGTRESDVDAAALPPQSKMTTGGRPSNGVPLPLKLSRMRTGRMEAVIRVNPTESDRRIFHMRFTMCEFAVRAVAAGHANNLFRATVLQGACVRVRAAQATRPALRDAGGRLSVAVGKGRDKQ
jgi:hypothetical protein